ncbi:MAG: 1,6-anhydro-N-acetylmuramyl-L-alanine amidase AmpD [Deltaproteobacteria bacterium]|nr:1,6-anhydro-N-acetylmuramyl-L-alanine amidase AmpD [Candidatus Anaeroferrophillus wilburensis]MBN2888166.1 1,6-anhydro-N-acetylmuramyl-L-alanine amidase AmpD [Deltaproteobacteria bacterium]
MEIIDIPSPNCDDRPPGAEISLVVIHAISLPPGEFGSGRVVDFFCNRLPVDEHPFFADIADLKVSAHYFIDRQGSVVRFVAEEKRAWHAGISSFNGRENCNDFSLGIELEGDDDRPFTEAQYQCLNRLLADIRRRHRLVTGNRIVGHGDIAPGRKTDPGPFFLWEKVSVR